MKPTNKSASGTSYWEDTLTTTVNEIKRAFSDAIDDGGDGGYKSRHGFIFETDNGDIVTIYDYKVGPFNDNDIVEFHIGGKSKEITSSAKRVFESLIVNYTQYE